MSDIAKAAKISRQAVYLHFPNRAELLIATTRYLDKVHDVEARLAASRAAKTGVERLEAFIDAWGNYIPVVYGVAKALLAMREADPEADAAWNDRMRAVRHGCKAAVQALDDDKVLSNDLNVKHATDVLWTLLSIRNWEQLRYDCSWSQKKYISFMKHTASQVLLKP